METWPTGALLTAIERGGLSHWRRLVRAVDADPGGPVARRIEEALAVTRPYGAAELMDDAIGRARGRAEEQERAAVAAEIAELVRASGMTRADFARSIGTSASRLSTYVGGSVTPSATMLVRMRRERPANPVGDLSG